MADFGLTRALATAVRKGAKGAKVLRPAEEQLLQKEADIAAREGKAAVAPVVPETVAPQPVVQPAPVSTKVGQTPAVDETPEPIFAPADQATAMRLSKANLGDYALDESFQTNFDTITTTDEVKAVIADTAQRNTGKITEARRGTITNEQLRGLAGELDMREDVLRQVLERESGGVLQPEVVLAARQVLNSSAERIKGLADKIATSKATDLEKIQFARQVQFHNEYQTQFMGARAEAGRALNAFGIPVGSDEVQAGRIAEMIANTGGDINRLAKAVHLTDSVAGVTQAVKSGIFRRAAGAANNLVVRNFVNGILSGPLTHMVNTGGNALFQSMQVAELAAAARLGRFLPGQESVIAGEASANLAGMLGGTRDAWRLAWRAMKTGRTLDDTLKYETGGRSTLDFLPELDKPYLGRMIRFTDAVIDAPTARGLGAEDEFFKTIAYRGDIQRQAFLNVRQRVGSGDITLADAERQAREFMESAPEEAQKAAEDWAREMTFQTPLGTAGQKVTAFLRHYPLLSLIAPFIRTPTNIFKQAAYRSPVAPLTAKFWRDIQAGGRARDLALTRFAMGSTTAALIASMVAEGRITGAGPQQPDAKQLWEAGGRRPYSVLITHPVTGEEVWKSYARMEPIASVVGSTADTTEILSYLNDEVETLTDEEQQAYNAAGSIVAGIMNNTGNKTFMKGIADFIEFATNPQMHVRPYLATMAAAQVPYSGLQKFIRSTQDPYLREAWTTIDKIRDNTPGYSEDLPPRRGLFGELREKPHGSLLGTMSPIPGSEVKYDRVVDELNRIMEATRLVPLTMPDKKVEGMRLTAAEYEQLVRSARRDAIFDDETVTLHEKIAEVIESDLYQDLAPAGRIELIKSVQRTADEAGRAKLEDENASFAERLALRRAKKDRLRYGENAE